MLLLHFFATLLWLHPIHVSVTEVEYSEKNKSLQITSRIFIDDLETSIRTQLKQEGLDILEPKNGMTVDQLVSGYLKEHIKIKIDGKPAKVNYLAHEVEDLAIICYLEVEGVKKMKSLEVTNDIIMETHEDQSNLVHVTYKGPVKSARLTRNKSFETFAFASK